MFTLIFQEVFSILFWYSTFKINIKSIFKAGKIGNSLCYTTVFIIIIIDKSIIPLLFSIYCFTASIKFIAQYLRLNGDKVYIPIYGNTHVYN